MQKYYYQEMCFKNSVLNSVINNAINKEAKGESLSEKKYSAIMWRALCSIFSILMCYKMLCDAKNDIKTA